MDSDEYKMNRMLQAIYPRSNPELGDADDLGLETLILNELPLGKQYKTARIISKVCDNGDGRFSADEVANKIKAMAEDGKVLTYGNLSKWAYSEVKLASTSGD